MAASWTCHGFGLVDYMYFYNTVVEGCGVVLYLNDQPMTGRLPQGPADWKPLLSLLITLDVFPKRVLNLFCPSRLSVFDDECDMSPYQD